MSVAAMTFVFEHSEAQGLERLVLLCHADHAHGAEPPWQSYAGVLLVSHETRATRRGVQEATKRLRKAGRLRDTGERRGGSPVYELVVDAARDAADREVRIQREEQERTRPRKGAKDLRPSDDVPEGEDPSPAEGEESSPHGAESDDAGAENDRVNAERRSPEPVGTGKEPAAANAAAADASASSASTASAAGSSSGTEKPRDLGDVFYDRAADLLVHAGFEPAAVSADRLKIRTELRKHGETLPTVDWAVLAEQLKAGRADRTIYADTPTGVLAFGLRQRSRGHLVGGQVRPPVAAPGPAPASKIAAPPPPTDEAESAWTWLREQFAERIEGAGAWDTWLGAVAPLQVADGRTLEITGPPHAATWIEERLVPSLQSLCRASGADLRWVDPADAAERSAA